MVAIIEELLQNNQELVTISMDSSVLTALQLMVNHDFSQLPIVDVDGKQMGIVTAEGILKSQRNFGASLGELRVQHSSTTAALASPADDVFDVFNQFERNSAVLIVDNQNRLLGIITPWDTAAYLQRRAEDIMLVEDVESMLKDHIIAAYTDPQNGLLDENALKVMISKMVDRSEKNYKTIERSLKQYLNRTEIRHIPSREKIVESFSEAIFSASDEKSFDELTFYQFMELLLHTDIWNEYGKMFMLESSHMRKLLDDVREIRNKLAHFRGELTEEERKKVRFCRDWFQRYPPKDFTKVQAENLREKQHNSVHQADVFDFIPAEEIEPHESRYAKFAIYLQALNVPKVTFSFEEIEEILDGELPPSAWEHRSWWANDSVGHVQSKQWLDAGWRVASINMSEHRVAFSRIEEREEMYIRFFGQLLDSLRETDFMSRDVNPTGASWIYVKTLPQNRSGQYLTYAFSFSRSKRFRVEMYIDTKEQNKNHAIFDLLKQDQNVIEDKIGIPLSWERLDDKRACRIAVYHDGHIEDPESQLDLLIAWAVSTMLKFESVMTTYAEPALEEIL